MQAHHRGQKSSRESGALRFSSVVLPATIVTPVSVEPQPKTQKVSFGWGMGNGVASHFRRNRREGLVVPGGMPYQIIALPPWVDPRNVASDLEDGPTGRGALEQCGHKSRYLYLKRVYVGNTTSVGCTRHDPGDWSTRVDGRPIMVFYVRL